MKRTFLLSALLCATCAFAQAADVVLPTSATISASNVESVDQWGVETLSSVNDTITVAFDTKPSVDVTVMFVTGSGFSIDMSYERYKVEDKTFVLPLTREMWGVPYNEVFTLNLVFTFTYGEGEDIEYYLDEDGAPVVFEAMYQTPDLGPAEFVRSYPSGEWYSYYTFEDAYENGLATLYFTKEVSLEESIGTINYYLFNSEVQTVNISDFEAEWSEWDGLFTVNFTYSQDGLSASEIEAIEIEFTGISNDEGELNIPIIELENTATSDTYNVSKKITASLSQLGEEEYYDVYNLQGLVVGQKLTKQELNNLPKGLYVINGKKFAVR